MKILVFNAGSSSLKFRLISMPGEEELLAGEAQRVATKTDQASVILYQWSDGVQQKREADMPTHLDALREATALIAEREGMTPDAIGHRFVHGGSRFTEDVAAVGPETFAELDAIADLAPLHNPPAIAAVRACHTLYPSIDQFLVFDTAFHRTIPEAASTYPLPEWLRTAHGLRKYGFHGISHGYVTAEAARLAGKPLDEFNAVSCHLGSGGASLCAVRGGRSVDNTMGHSPLQGLVMSTRCGDLDPAVALSLISRSGGDVRAVEKLLNKKSGVLGLSQISSDIRDIVRIAGEGGPDAVAARRTLDIYTWRIRKYLGAYLVLPGRVDAVIFTDTIGEGVPEVREAVCRNLEPFGLRLDPDANTAATSDSLPADVAAANSAVRIYAIRTNEELAIARSVSGVCAPAMN